MKTTTRKDTRKDFKIEDNGEVKFR